MDTLETGTGKPDPQGAHLENLILLGLLAWRDARTERVEILFWRTAIGEEVDFVIESKGKLLPIEVKATTRPRLSDTTGIRAFRREYGPSSLPGLLLHAGNTLAWLTNDALAVPWWQVC